MTPVKIDGIPRNQPAAGDNKLYLTRINVGMGDCTLIVMPNGKRAVIDCSSTRREGVTVADIQKSFTTIFDIIVPVDLMVLSHPDRDHYNLVGAVFEDAYIGKVVHSMTLSDYSAYAFRKWWWSSQSNVGTSQGVTVNATSPNEVMLLDGGKGVKLYAVAANVPYPTADVAMVRNTASVVVVARDTNTPENLFLVAADATCPTENFMLGGGRVSRIQNVRVVRVGHHGSDTSSRQTFVNATNPSYAAIISSSQNNGIYCLPKESVVDRWLAILPDAQMNKQVGYWEDGAGTECRTLTEAADEEALIDAPEDDAAAGVGLPYNYGTATVQERLYETFIDGTKAMYWGPY